VNGVHGKKEKSQGILRRPSQAGQGGQRRHQS
jgi:hypothetical protein